MSQKNYIEIKVPELDRFHVFVNNTSVPPQFSNPEASNRMKENRKIAKLKIDQEKGVRKWIPEKFIVTDKKETDRFMAIDGEEEGYVRENGVLRKTTNKDLVEALLSIHSFYSPNTTREEFTKDLINKLDLCSKNDSTVKKFTRKEIEHLNDSNLTIEEAMMKVDKNKLSVYGI